MALLNDREKMIELEHEDPLRYGWEPPIWRVCDSMLGFDWVDPDYAERMRQLLEMKHPVNTLLILGGNRGTKSEYGGSRGMKVLARVKRARAWCLHSKEQMSIDYQQPLLWKYMPKEWRVQIKSALAYVAYRAQTGFSEGKFILPNGSDGRFLNYTMDRTTVEGGNLDYIWPDELVPPDWVETMELRIAERNGKMVITFTPVEGYSFTVRMFQDGARLVRTSLAYLLPRDGGPWDVARALQLSPEECAEVERAYVAGENPKCLPCRPENCDAWLDGKSGQPEPPAGREFERVPRVMKCSPATDPREQRAIVFFHSSDNPYGNPISVVSKLAGRAADHVKERFYGIARKLASVKFPKFCDRHIIPADQIPSQGTNYHVMDPAGNRNFFMLWFRVTKDHIYIYREWPGYYPVPRHGVPGAWAIPDGQRIDGRAGPAQVNFGWGYWRYKAEIARLEGWADYTRGRPTDRSLQENDWIDSLRAEHGAREKMQARYVDSRFASNPRMEKDRPVTLLSDFSKIGLYFKPAPGDDIDEGETKINTLLDFNEHQPASYFNTPTLLVSAACQNTIFALSVWTGEDGQKGATKDPIDVIRYFALAGRGFVSAEMWLSGKGGHY